MLRLLAILLAVPIISLAAAWGVQHQDNSEWRSALQQQIDQIKIPPETSAKEHREAVDSQAEMQALQLIPLQKVCSDSKLSDLWTACDEFNMVNLMGRIAVRAAVLGVGLIMLIALAGRLSRLNRRLLVVLFRPGLYLTILALSALIFLHAALAMGAIYFGEGALVGRVHFGIMITIALGALAGTAAMVREGFNVVKNASTTVLGKKLNLDQGVALREFLKELTSKVGTAMPDNVVLGLTQNFFVTEADVTCLDGVLTGRTLYISLPLSRILTRSEMSSVLGHELGHYKGFDTLFSQKFYPVYRGTAQSIAGLAGHIGDDAGGIALLPALWTLSYFYDHFAVAETAIGRDRELQADAVGAQVTSARTTATALLKVCAFAPLWDGVYEQMQRAISDGKQFVNVSAYWAGIISHSEDKTIFLEGIDERQLAHPTDSHPPLGVRLDALGLSVSQIESDALHTAPPHHAIELIADYESLEKELTEVEHLLLADSMKRTTPQAAED